MHDATIRFGALKGLGILMLLSMASAAYAAQSTDLGSTESLLSMCQPQGSDYGYCLGFISGMAAVMEQVGIGATGDFRGAMGMCPSKPYPTADAEVEAFIAWAQRNPQFGNKPSVVGVTIALDSTWPCEGQH